MLKKYHAGNDWRQLTEGCTLWLCCLAGICACVAARCQYICWKRVSVECLWRPKWFFRPLLPQPEPSSCSYAAHSRRGAWRSSASPCEYLSLSPWSEGTLEAGVGHAGWGSGTLQGQRLARHGRIPDNWHPPRRHLSPSPILLKTTATKTPFSAGHGGANPLSTKTRATDSI